MSGRASHPRSAWARCTPASGIDPPRAWCRGTSPLKARRLRARQQDQEGSPDQVISPVRQARGNPVAAGPAVLYPSTLSAPRAWLVSYFGEDLIAQIDALVADVHAGTANELFDLL